jgi:hypothetical protein
VSRMDFPRTVPPETRLRIRLEEKSTPVPESGCWLWLGNPNASGYGLVTHMGRSILAHRAAHIIFKGAIPEGMEVCHKCDTPLCINPAHLFAATHGENMRDAHRKGRKSNKRESNPRAKVTSSQVAAIRNDGRLVRVIARDFGISPAAVSMIRTGRNWK